MSHQVLYQWRVILVLLIVFGLGLLFAESGGGLADMFRTIAGR